MFLATAKAWSQDKAMRFSAALAYYAIFSLAPLLIIAISTAGLLFGEEAARGEVFQQIEWLLGEKSAAEIQSIIQATGQSSKGIVGTIVGVATLLLGASGVFGQLKDALNTIWGVRIISGGWRTFLLNYLLSFSMVLGVGFLLIVSLLVSATIHAVTTYLSGFVSVPAIATPVDLVISFALLTLLFGLIYKVLPDVIIAWRDVWMGAAVTAVLFAIGKIGIGWYLGTSSVASSFGAAGALILILVWIYYSTTIFFFGAEFTRVYAANYGSDIRPKPHAELTPAAQRCQEGLEEKTSHVQSGAMSRNHH